MNNWEQWIDPWLAALRQEGLSGVQIERQTKMLGVMAAREWTPKGPAEQRPLNTFQVWVSREPGTS